MSCSCSRKFVQTSVAQIVRKITFFGGIKCFAKIMNSARNIKHKLPIAANSQICDNEQGCIAVGLCYTRNLLLEYRLLGELSDASLELTTTNYERLCDRRIKQAERFRHLSLPTGARATRPTDRAEAKVVHRLSLTSRQISSTGT